jgi:hypothetical protein
MWYSMNVGSKRLIALLSAVAIFAVNAAPGLCALLCQVNPCSEPVPVAMRADHACCQKANQTAKATCYKCAKQAEILKAKQNAKLAATFFWDDSMATLPSSVAPAQLPEPLFWRSVVDGPNRAHAPPLIVSRSPRAPPVG